MGTVAQHQMAEPELWHVKQNVDTDTGLYKCELLEDILEANYMNIFVSRVHPSILVLLFSPYCFIHTLCQDRGFPNIAPLPPLSSSPFFFYLFIQNSCEVIAGGERETWQLVRSDLSFSSSCGGILMWLSQTLTA